MTIALFVVSCRSSRTVSKVSVSEATSIAMGDTTQKKSAQKASVHVTLSPAGTDTVALRLSAGMVDSLPEGASWVEQSNGTTLVATKTPRGLVVMATRPHPPDVSAEASSTCMAEDRSVKSVSMQEVESVESEAKDVKDELLLEELKWTGIILSLCMAGVTAAYLWRNRR